MKVLILGGQGMLGHKLFKTLQPCHDIYATVRQAGGPWQAFPMYREQTHVLSGVDALQFDTVVEAMATVRPDVVINCIGIIKQLDKDKDRSNLIAVNALFPHRLHKLSRASGARLLQISTDCVFSGAKGSYSESDIPDAVDWYGRTKLLGEVDASDALTIRTSVIGRDYLKNVGLLEWFLSNRGSRVNGFSQAIFSGFTTQALSRIIDRLITDFPTLSGIYHIASQPLSKLSLLEKFRDAGQLDIEIVPDSNFHCDRSLDASRFLEATNYLIPSWNEMIAELVQDIASYDQWRKQYAAFRR